MSKFTEYLKQNKKLFDKQLVDEVAEKAYDRELPDITIQDFFQCPKCNVNLVPIMYCDTDWQNTDMSYHEPEMQFICLFCENKYGTKEEGWLHIVIQDIFGGSVLTIYRPDGMTLVMPSNNYQQQKNMTIEEALKMCNQQQIIIERI